MITLSILGYVFISLYFALEARKEHYEFEKLVQGKEWKPALIEGFLIPIVYVVAMGVVIGIFWLVIRAIILLFHAVMWIALNMP